MSITRRSFGRLMGASFGMVALRGFANSKDSNAYFTHGVASGDPLKDRVILWTRVIPGDGFDRGLDVEWQVAADKDSKVTSSGHFFTDASRDFTVKVDASALEPGRQYFYRFISEGGQSDGCHKNSPRRRGGAVQDWYSFVLELSSGIF